jgi:hypothetical protein
MSETKNLNPNNAIMREFQVIVFQWTVGIPVGTNLAPLHTDFSLLV